MVPYNVSNELWDELIGITINSNHDEQFYVGQFDKQNRKILN